MDRTRVRQQMDEMDTEELLAIYQKHDATEYVPEVFEVIAQILTERDAKLPDPEPVSGVTESSAASSVPHSTSRPDGGFLSFQKMISVELIRGVYVLGALGLTVFGVIVILDGRLAAGLLLIVGGNILWRLVCEAGILLFSIHERLVSIDKKVG